MRQKFSRASRLRKVLEIFWHPPLPVEANQSINRVGHGAGKDDVFVENGFHWHPLPFCFTHKILCLWQVQPQIESKNSVPFVRVKISDNGVRRIVALPRKPMFFPNAWR